MLGNDFVNQFFILFYLINNVVMYNNFKYQKFRSSPQSIYYQPVFINIYTYMCRNETCSRQMPGSLGYEEQDANTFASWVRLIPF